VGQRHTGRLTGFWFLLDRPKGWILMNEGMNLEEDVCSSIQIPTCARLSLLHNMHVDTIHRTFNGDILCWCRESMILKTIQSNTVTFIKKNSMFYKNSPHMSDNKAITKQSRYNNIQKKVAFNCSSASFVYFCSSFVWRRPYYGGKIQRIFVKTELFT
jgi:hypothetical protein